MYTFLYMSVPHLQVWYGGIIFGESDVQLRGCQFDCCIFTHDLNGVPRRFSHPHKPGSEGQTGGS